MKEVNIKRFQQKNPEDISFQGNAIPDRAPVIPKNIPQPSEKKEEKRTNDVSSERTTVRTNERNTAPKYAAEESGSPSANSYTVEIPAQRSKIRHSFDIFEDQKLALSKIQMAMMDSGYRKKPVLGDMIQEAVDLYIKEKCKKLDNLRIVNERPSERSDERS